MHNIFVSDIRKYFRIFFCVAMLFSLSNSFIFEFLDSSVYDTVEWAESGAEDEEGEDEFIWMKYSVKSDIFKNREATNWFHTYRSNAYIDISIPPPEAS